MDLFITLLQMGENTLKQLLKQRKDHFKMLHDGLTKIAEKHGERLLVTKNNKISMACTLTALNQKVFVPNNINATYFGSYLFSRRVSGVRVVNSSFGKESKVGKYTFVNYGSHCNDYKSLPYFTAAASVGQTHQEV